MKVYISNTKEKYYRYGSAGRLLLEEKGYELVYNETGLKRLPKDALMKILKDADAAIVTSGRWDEELFAAAPRLKVLAKYGVGVDNIDCAAAKKHGIKVTTAKGGNSEAVAELAVGLMLSVLRKIPQLDAKAKEKGWYRSIGQELQGKTVGLLGFGDIGQHVARLLSGFNVKICAYDPYPNEEAAQLLHVQLADWQTVLKTSDLVSIHMPGLEETRHFMNRKSFEMMREGSYFINTARGSLVDEDALCDALDNGRLGGAALDVFDKEPLTGTERVLHTERLVTIPHAGAETEEAYGLISKITAESIIAVLEGHSPANWVNR